MLKQIAFAATLALSASVAMAADTGVYAGADIGTTKVDDMGGRKTSFGGFIGYQINPNIAAELGYHRLASYSEKILGVNVDVDMYQTSLSVLGIAPMGNGFSVYGRMGYADLSAKVSGNGRTGRGSDSGTIFGIGAKYDINPNFGVRAEWKRTSSDSNNFNVGFVAKF